MLKIVAYFAFLIFVVVLSLQLAIYKRNSTNINTPVSEPTQHTEIVLTGDVMLGRTVMTKSLELNDPIYPMRLVADELQKADLVLINLENPIIENCPLHYGGFIFCASPVMLDSLTHGGVDIVNLANNHTLNYNQNGFDETKQHLNNAGVSYTGDGNLHAETINGTTFGFIGFDKSQQANPVLTTEERSLVTTSNESVDVLVVSMHWGVEYQDTASPGQEVLAKELVNLGADVIVGHHPHWVQNIDYIDEVPVYYSLGNFIFDQMFEDKVREGLVVRLTFDKKKIVEEQLITTFMSNWSQPEFRHDH